MAAWVDSQAASETTGDAAQVEPRPKPQRRIRASQDDWSDLHRLFHGQGCVACGITPTEIHHVVPRSQGGDDIEKNLVPLCHPHHQMLEDHASGWEQVAGHVRSYVWARSSRLHYVLEKIGLERFDKRYPLPPFLAIGDLDRMRTPDPWLRENGDEI